MEIERPTCPECKKRRCERDYKRPNKFRRTCERCRRPDRHNLNSYKRRVGAVADWLPKERCVRCGFVAEDPCQLDYDHIDGNRENDARENLQVLCANCHRLKSRREWDNCPNRNYTRPRWAKPL